ncbi:hypothetical protein HPB47_005872, partial [Ixodes persulcatus]
GPHGATMLQHLLHAAAPLHDCTPPNTNPDAPAVLQNPEGAKRRASMKGDTIGDVFGVNAPEPEENEEPLSGYEEDAPYPDDQIDEQGDDEAPAAPPNEQRRESAEKLV